MAKLDQEMQDAWELSLLIGICGAIVYILIQVLPLCLPS